MPYSDIGGRGFPRLCRKFSQVDWIKCITNRLLRAARREAGITLIETVFAIAIFGVVSTSVIGVLTSATAADGNARQKTIAIELAQQQIEYVRQLGYADVCVTGGNPTCPSGVTGIPSSQQKWVMGLRYKLATSIRWVNDAVPTAVATSANYKRVRVTVTRASDNKLLARVYTYVANPSRAQLGGINNAVINVNVVDNGYLAAPSPSTPPVQGAQVDIWDGPSPHSSDVTDETGVVAFAGLPPNPADTNGVLLATGPTAYYDILATLSGYQTLREELPPGTVPTGSGAGPVNAAHLQIGPNQTQSTTIHLYRPATIIVDMNNSDGSPYTGGVCVDVGAPSPRGAQEFCNSSGYSNGIFSITPPTTIGGEQAVSGAPYTVGVRSYDGTKFASSLKQTVPSNYPTDLTSTFTVQLQTVTTKSCTITFKKGSTAIQNARVDIIDGVSGTPVQIYATGVTNSSGQAVFNGVASIALPVTTDYDIKAWGTLSSTVVSGGLTDQVVPTSGTCSFAVSGS